MRGERTSGKAGDDMMGTQVRVGSPGVLGRQVELGERAGASPTLPSGAIMGTKNSS
jgi:hypothetical protein